MAAPVIVIEAGVAYVRRDPDGKLFAYDAPVAYVRSPVNGKVFRVDAAGVMVKCPDRLHWLGVPGGPFRCPK